MLVPEGAARHPDVLDHVSGQRVGDVAEEESHATGQHVPAERRNREVGVFGPVRPPVADGLYEPATGTRQIKGPKVGPGGKEVTARKLCQTRALRVGPVVLIGLEADRVVADKHQGPTRVAPGPIGLVQRAGLDVGLVPALLSAEELGQGVCAAEVRVVTRVLWLRHVLEDVRDLSERAEQPGGVPVPLDTTALRQRAELIDARIGERKLVLAARRPSPLPPERPVGRRDTGDKRDPGAAALDVEEVVLGPIDVRMRIFRLRTPQLGEHEVRLKVVLADRALDHPASSGPVVAEFGQLRERCDGPRIKYVTRTNVHRVQISSETLRGRITLIGDAAVGSQMVRLGASAQKKDADSQATD